MDKSFEVYKKKEKIFLSLDNACNIPTLALGKFLMLRSLKMNIVSSFKIIKGKWNF